MMEIQKKLQLFPKNFLATSFKIGVLSLGYGVRLWAGVNGLLLDMLNYNDSVIAAAAAAEVGAANNTTRTAAGHNQ
ncbi:hypothetical protein Tco_1119282, partial [Tanacetum coccineum]